MAPHFARELEQRRRDLLNPPHWVARRRKRERLKAATSSGIPSVGDRLNARRADPLDAPALTPLQREAAGYWRTPAETPHGAPRAGANASQFVDLRVYVQRRTPMFTFEVARAVVIEGRGMSRLALNRIATCLMEEPLFHRGSL